MTKEDVQKMGSEELAGLPFAEIVTERDVRFQLLPLLYYKEAVDVAIKDVKARAKKAGIQVKVKGKTLKFKDNIVWGQ